MSTRGQPAGQAELDYLLRTFGLSDDQPPFMPPRPDPSTDRVEAPAIDDTDTRCRHLAGATGLIVGACKRRGSYCARCPWVEAESREDE